MYNRKIGYGISSTESIINFDFAEIKGFLRGSGWTRTTDLTLIRGAL